MLSQYVKICVNGSLYRPNFYHCYTLQYPAIKPLYSFLFIALILYILLSILSCFRFNLSSVTIFYICLISLKCINWNFQSKYWYLFSLLFRQSLYPFLSTWPVSRMFIDLHAGNELRNSFLCSPPNAMNIFRNQQPCFI